MLFQLICGALALSEVAWGRGAPAAAPAPRDRGRLDGVSNLQMLIPLLIEDSQAEESRVPPAPRAPRYTDGPYSDIPAEAFLMEPSKASEKHKSTFKKDLGQFRAAEDPSPSPPPPDAVVAGCVRYFQGRSAASSARNTEALLQLCTEILEDAQVEDVVHIHVDEEPCSCCVAQPPAEPPAEGPRPRAQEPLGGQALGSLVQTLLKLFSSRTEGTRRRWLIMNSNHPDPQMRQYVDVEM